MNSDLDSVWLDAKCNCEAFLRFGDRQKVRFSRTKEFGVVAIAELVDYPDKAPVSVAGIVTTLRVRTTKKGEAMAWIVISDGSAGLECAVFPSAYAKLNGSTVLREGAFLVGRGRLAREEATGYKAFLDDIIPMGGRGAHLSALAVAVEQRRDDVPPPSSLIA